MNRTVLAGLAICLLLAGLAAPFASSHPDGLERVAEDHGIAASPPVWNAAPAADYAMPGIRHAGLATGLAGAAGVLLLLAAGWGLARLLRRRSA